MKKVLIMAGGTGGHIFPALVIAKKLKKLGVDVFWLGTRRGLEAKLVPQAGFSIDYISIGGVRRTGLFNRFISPFRVLIACVQTFLIFLKRKPNCVLGMGGFVSGPGGLVAWLLHKPLIIHEQNAVMGLTNKILLKFARKIFFKAGSPVREEILATIKPTQRLTEHRGPLRLLVLGGSRGALFFNRLVVDTLIKMPRKDRPIVWHQTGRQYFDVTKKNCEEKSIALKLMPFIDDMAEAYAWADLVLCRAGAMTISELIAVGVASILVPFPFAVDDHQTQNSKQLVEVGAAICVEQRDLSEDKLMHLLMAFNRDRKRLLKMAQAARDLNEKTGDVAEKVVQACLDIAKN